MQTWSEAFKGYINRRWPEHAQKEASFALRVTPSTIHYWCRGARPREERTRKRIARWSKGEVSADLPAAIDAAAVLLVDPNFTDASHSARRAG